MRILFTSPPGAGHFFPTVPLAWALRSAGHDVLVGTTAEGVAAAATAGLPVVDVAPGAPINAVFGAGVGTRADRARRMRERGRRIAAAGDRIDPLLLETFGRVSDLMADGTVALARWWRPDLVVHSRLHPAGLLAARAVRVPAIEHGFNLLREAELATRFLPYLATAYRRHDVPLELPDRIVLHLAPDELMSGGGPGWPMQYVPYNAGGALPPWLHTPPGRPRVLITLGTVVPALAGFDGLRSTVEAAAHVDAEFVLAAGDQPDLAVLGKLPRNVRVAAGWLPLQPVLAGCAAVVHHGGSGTMMTALSSGVAQLVLPHGADQFANADQITRHRLGLCCAPAEVTPRVLDQVLARDVPTSGVAAAAERMAELPPPAEIALRLAAADRLAGGRHPAGVL
ncbi:nucleotide disphospho-sugar-binding domain-containing protein [Solwaraspora sp. WMMB335]|uniref:nucleotide disphospho-sugar-binding domain-containing protein n=1 Tax=Solwaraspora sp. WMMB335 TaxID=3404118 RepID=UPI003B93D0A1